MRNLLKALLVVALAVPAIANAAIANTKHDLASGSTTTGPKAAAVGGTDQTCIFCHAPHRANQQQLIWNHSPAATAGGWAGAQTTTANTALPVTLGPKSQVCLTCHDGSVSLGSLSSGTITMNGTDTNAGGNLTNAVYLVGPSMGGATAGNHPVSIPYASMTYNSITSTAAAAGYVAVASGAANCTSPSGICTADAVNGKTIQLFGTAAAAGIECGSCHDVHNALSAPAFFLRAPAAGSALCKACHIK
jgi:predicted CXXCH cytochrome family protein